MKLKKPKMNWLQMKFIRAALHIKDFQKPFSKAHPIWIHVVFRKTKANCVFRRIVTTHSATNDHPFRCIVTTDSADCDHFSSGETTLDQSYFIR
jgi:hypothetical protein